MIIAIIGIGICCPGFTNVTQLISHPDNGLYRLNGRFDLWRFLRNANVAFNASIREFPSYLGGCFQPTQFSYLRECLLAQELDRCTHRSWVELVPKAVPSGGLDPEVTQLLLWQRWPQNAIGALPDHPPLRSPAYSVLILR